MKADGLRLLVRLERAQRMVTDTSRLHRVFFQELVFAARSHAARTAPGGAAGAPVAPAPDSAMGGDMDKQHGLQTFLSHHFLADPLAEELQVWTDGPRHCGGVHSCCSCIAAGFDQSATLRICVQC